MSGKRFQSATSFSIHCKRLQTPNKQGDDGWKSTLYEGQPLEAFRKKYLHRIQGAKDGGSDAESEVSLPFQSGIHQPLKRGGKLLSMQGMKDRLTDLG